MDINSNDSYEEEFESSDIAGKQTIFPSRNQILIGLLISAIIIVILEKIFISIFFYFFATKRKDHRRWPCFYLIFIIICEKCRCILIFCICAFTRL